MADTRWLKYHAEYTAHDRRRRLFTKVDSINGMIGLFTEDSEKPGILSLPDNNKRVSENIGQCIEYLRFISRDRGGLAIRHLIVESCKNTYRVLSSGLLDECLKTLFVILTRPQHITDLIDFVNRNRSRLHGVIVYQHMNAGASGNRCVVKLMQYCGGAFGYEFIRGRAVLYAGDSAVESVVRRLRPYDTLDSLIFGYIEMFNLTTLGDSDGGTSTRTDYDIYKSSASSSSSPPQQPREITDDTLCKNINLLPMELREMIVSRLPYHTRYRIAMYLRAEEPMFDCESRWINVLLGSGYNRSGKHIVKICNAPAGVDDDLFYCRILFHHQIVEWIDNWEIPEKWFRVLSTHRVKLCHFSTSFNESIAKMIDMTVFDSTLNTLILYVYFPGDFRSIYKYLHRQNTILNRFMIVFQCASLYNVVFHFLNECCDMKFKYKFVSPRYVVLLWTRRYEDITEIPYDIKTNTMSKILDMQLEFTLF